DGVIFIIRDECSSDLFSQCSFVVESPQTRSTPPTNHHAKTHSGSADDLFHKSISGLIVAIFRTTFKSTTITVEDNFNCEKLKN
ncbi:hypothetical protein DPMN_083742, partial [Dreissena polymorpha]